MCVIDSDGRSLFSGKVGNDKAEILAVLAAVTAMANDPVWAVDVIGRPSELLLALLARAGQRLLCASGRVVSAISTAFTGEGKTDAKGAHVIAPTVRLRRDLSPVDPGTDIGVVDRAPRGSGRGPRPHDQPAP